MGRESELKRRDLESREYDRKGSERKRLDILKQNLTLQM